MSRSHRKSPFRGWTSAASDKPYKSAEHRRQRRSARVVLRCTSDDADSRLHSVNYGNPWNAPKDGKVRLDPVRDPVWMRK